MISLFTIEQCQKREPAAQKKIFERYADTLFRLAYRYMKNELEAEDVVTEAFMKIFTVLPKSSFEAIQPFEAWIRRIVVNEALMQLRKRTNFGLMANIETTEVPENETILDKLSADEIFNLITQLPDGYRTVFNLYAVDGYNHAEIAKKLGISEGTSKSQLSKARAMLQKWILASNKQSKNEEFTRFE